MLVTVNCAKCIGIDAVGVSVEVDISRGIGIHLVGLADVAVKESLLRTTTALSSLGFRIPGKKIVINLAPADIHKSGGGYDLPIAVGIIAASQQRTLPHLGEFVIMGELGLEGGLRNIPGALPIVDYAVKNGFKGVILPYESALEAAEFINCDIYAARNLEEVLRVLEGGECGDLLAGKGAAATSPPTECSQDFSDIIGQEEAKRGAEIAAAGGHNMIMIGSPGSGKSSLAKAIATILPPMSDEEALVTSKIYSIAGKGGGRLGYTRLRPFRAPHCSASLPAIIGGGCSGTIIPGEISLAQNGILFLDEFAEIPGSVIEALRAPLEDREVVISRLRGKVRFPASFMLVAASNPCPCGYWGDGDRCNCTPFRREQYLSKLSGPVMDRIDIQVRMHRVPSDRILAAPKPESSGEIARRVARARYVQASRFKGEGIFTNAEMNVRQIEKYCPLDGECTEILSSIMDRMELSMRAYWKIIRISRTIADLEGAENIRSSHILEASAYRFLDRQSL